MVVPTLVLQRFYLLNQRSILDLGHLLVMAVACLDLCALELAHVLDGVRACQEAQVVLALLSATVQDDLHLIRITNHVDFPRSATTLIVVTIPARREREARPTLEKVAFLLELLVEGVGVLVQVLEQLVDYAAKTPHVCRVIILFLDQRHLWRPIPSRPHVDGHISFHLLPSVPVIVEELGYELLLLRLALTGQLVPVNVLLVHLLLYLVSEFHGYYTLLISATLGHGSR